MDADPDGHVLGAELPLHPDGASHRIDRVREHAQAAVAQSLDDRAAAGVVVRLERGRVPLPLVDRRALVALHERGVPANVVEHLGAEPAVEAPAPTRGTRSRLEYAS